MAGAAPADTALASLAAPPTADLDRDLLRLKVITEARDRGLTWAQIGSVYGMDAKQAKKHAKDLRGSCQRRVIARDVAAARDTGDAA